MPCVATILLEKPKAKMSDTNLEVAIEEKICVYAECVDTDDVH